MKTEAICLAAGIVAGAALGGMLSRGEKSAAPAVDTIIIISHDTLLVEKPIAVAVEPLDVRRVTLPLWRAPADTAAPAAVDVALATERKVYADSAYRAVVSGAFVSLDSIEIYRPTITRQITVEKRRRWALGPSLTLGYDGRRLAPAIGLSLTYSFFSF